MPALSGHFYVQDVRYAAGCMDAQEQRCTGCTVCCGCMDAQEQRCTERPKRRYTGWIEQDYYSQ